MTKAELTKRLKDEVGLQSQAMADRCFDALCGIITAELLGGGKVSLPGVGTLGTRSYGPRKGRNPRTGEAIELPAGVRAFFSATKSLKDALK